MTPTPKSCPYRFDTHGIPRECLGAKCMAWHPEVPASIVCKEGYSYDYESCRSRRTAEECAGCELHRIKKATDGFCKIIDGGRRWERC